MVYSIEKGGNYGWSVQEGDHPFRPERKKGPTPILKPIIEHTHTEFRSLTGGFVYHGKRLPELKGAYIYGDYDTGRVWMLRYDANAKRVTEHKELAKSTLRIVAWGQDADGEVYALELRRRRHLPPRAAPPTDTSAAAFPRKLSETGVFADTKTLTPATGLIPYSVNAELWSDGATKERFIAIPGEGKIEYETVTYPAARARRGAGLALPGWHRAGQDVLPGNRTGPAAAAGNAPAGRVSATAARRNTAIRSGTATPTSGTTSRPTPNWPTSRASIASTPSRRNSGETQADVALPQPGRMHHVPHGDGQVRPRRQHRCR